MYYFNLLDFVVKIRHTNINYIKIFEREYFPIYGILLICDAVVLKDGRPTVVSKMASLIYRAVDSMNKTMVRR